MARLRTNPRRGRLLSRSLVGLLIVGCSVLALYAFNRTGEASADEGSQARVAVPTPTEPRTASNAVGTDEWADPTPAPAPPKVVEPEPIKADPPTGYMEAADAHADAGEVLEARAVLNAAFQTGLLDDEAADAVRERLTNLNRVIIFTPTKRYRDDPYQGEYVVQPGDMLGKISGPLNVPYAFLERVNGVKANRIRVGQSLKTIEGPIHAVVSKRRFTMDLFLGALPGEEGSMYLATYSVGLGSDDSTPTGLWEATRGSKLKNPEWTNPRTSEIYAADDPMNPLGERWIGLTGIAGDAIGQPSYGIHGTIEPETIGTNASMGCIRLAADDIAQVYDMLLPGHSTVRVTQD
jgi:LysM repeat protein